MSETETIQAQKDITAPKTTHSGDADIATETQSPSALDASNPQLSTRRHRDIIAEEFRNRTKGEALFNKISYIGVGYFLVTGVSIFMTWLLNDNPKYSAKFSETAKNFTKKMGFPPTIASIATLFIGGTIASVLPVKWLEDFKPQLVKRFDRFYYGDDKVKNDPTLIAAHRELEALPKQTWLSVLGSRIVAFAATFSVFFLMGSNKSPLAKIAGESIDKRSTQFGRWMDKLLNGKNPAIVAEVEATAAENIRRMSPSLGEEALKGPEIMRQGPNADRVTSRIWSYIGLDGFYTIITSGALFVFTRVFGGLFGKQSATPPIDQLTTQMELSRQSVKTPTPVADITPVADAAPDAPRAKIAQPAYHERVSAPTHEHHVTA